MTVANPSKDVQINNLIFIVYLLLIFEGALRKWIFPALSSPLYFVKEPIILYIYGMVYFNRRWPTNPLLTISIFLSFLFLILVLFQSLIYNFQLYIGLYGWRNYCLYIPLSFIIGKQYGEKEIIRIARFSCLISIPLAVLSYIQYKSAPTEYINKNVGLAASEIFTVVSGIVRPSATFSFTSGFSTFIACLFMFLLYNFYLGKKAFLKPWQFYISIFAFFTCLAVSGSRGAYFSVTLIGIFMIAASVFLLKKKQGFQIIFYSAVFSVLGIVLFSYVFDEQWGIIQQRQTMASNVEGSVWNRIVSIFMDLDFLLYTDLSLLGVGLGLGSGGGAFLSSGVASFAIAETEWARHMLEAGLIMGIIYILYRITLVIYIFKDALAGLFTSSNPVPLIFAGNILPLILAGPITGNGVTYSFTWIFLGFCLAVNKIYKK